MAEKKLKPSPYDLAREIVRTWLGGRDRVMALADIDRRELRAKQVSGKEADAQG